MDDEQAEVSLELPAPTMSALRRAKAKRLGLVANILAEQKRLNVQLSEYGTEKPRAWFDDDGRTLTINQSHGRVPYLGSWEQPTTPADKLRAYVGEKSSFYHIVGHVFYTTQEDKLRTLASETGMPPREVTLAIAHVLEDGRIERRLREEMGGTRAYLQFVGADFIKTSRVSPLQALAYRVRFGKYRDHQDVWSPHEAFIQAAIDAKQSKTVWDHAVTIAKGLCTEPVKNFVQGNESAWYCHAPSDLDEAEERDPLLRYQRALAEQKQEEAAEEAKQDALGQMEQGAQKELDAIDEDAREDQPEGTPAGSGNHGDGGESGENQDDEPEAEPDPDAEPEHEETLAEQEERLKKEFAEPKPTPPSDDEQTQAEKEASQAMDQDTRDAWSAPDGEDAEGDEAGSPMESGGTPGGVGEDDGEDQDGSGGDAESLGDQDSGAPETTLSTSTSTSASAGSDAGSLDEGDATTQFLGTSFDGDAPNDDEDGETIDGEGTIDGDGEPVPDAVELSPVDAANAEEATTVKEESVAALHGEVVIELADIEAEARSIQKESQVLNSNVEQYMAERLAAVIKSIAVEAHRPKWAPSRKTGSLDARRIVGLVTGDTFLRHREQEKSFKFSVAMCIDTSSSMGGAPLRDTLEAARAINAALEMADVPSTCIMYNTYVREAGKVPEAYSASGGTNTAGAQRKAAAWLNNQESRKLLLILTDGAPSNPEAELLATKQACKDNNILVVSVQLGMRPPGDIKGLARSNAVYRAKYYNHSPEQLAEVIKEIDEDESGYYSDRTLRYAMESQYVPNLDDLPVKMEDVLVRFASDY